MESVNVKVKQNKSDPMESNCLQELYEAIISNKITLIEESIKKWSGIKKSSNSNYKNFNELLSHSYSEIQLKNILLLKETKFFIEKHLIDNQHCDNIQGENISSKVNNRNIKKRLKFLNDNINLLITYNENDIVDEEFIYICKCIAKNINVLKQKLKFTYDRIPWEEIEFCLTCFISSYIKSQELNYYYRLTLNKSKILIYLEMFMKIINEKKNLEKNNTKIGLKREDVIANIINNNKDYKLNDMYNDYCQMKDIYSLYKINKYLKTSINVDVNKHYGEIVLKRTLQVICEYTKNTLDSPNLSKVISDLLLLSFSKSNRDLINNLKNNIDVFENSNDKFFSYLQNDLKAVHLVVCNMINEKNMSVFRKLIYRIKKDVNLNEIESFIDILDESMIDDYDVKTNYDIEEIFENLLKMCTIKSKYQKELLGRMESIFSRDRYKNTSKIPKLSFFNVFIIIKSTFSFFSKIKSSDYTITKFNCDLDAVLKNILPKFDEKHIKEIIKISLEFYNMSRIPVLLGGNNDAIDVMKENCKILKCEFEKQENLNKVIHEIFFAMSLQIEDNQWIEHMQKRIFGDSEIHNEDQIKNIKKSDDKKLFELLDVKIKELDKLFSKNVTCGSIENFMYLKNNDYLFIVIETLVIDIITILENLDFCVDNFNYLDENLPILSGKNLRNYLLHGNLLTEILCDPSMSIIINAHNLLNLNVKNKNFKTGELIKEDINKLKNDFERNLSVIKNQKKMFYLLSEGNLLEFQNIIKNGSDINGRDMNCQTAIHFAAKNENLNILKFIFKENFMINVKDNYGRTVLHTASIYGRKDNVKYLLEKQGCNINMKDNYLRTALLMACQNDHKEIVEILMENNCDVNCIDQSGYGTIHYAVVNNCKLIVEVLLEKSTIIQTKAFGGFFPLHLACEYGHFEMVELFLKNCTNVNIKNDSGSTPLHGASLQGDLNIVKVLVNYGADINARCVNGCTPLHFAVEKGHESVVNFLLKNKANVNISDIAFNNTPLHYAARYGFNDIVKILLKNKAKLEMVTIEKFTPLLFAAHMNHYDSFITLCKHGANITAKNKTGKTALHFAIENGNKKMVDYIIQQNKSLIFEKDCLKCTLLHSAANCGHKDIIELLIQLKIDINSVTITGLTPLHYATINDSNCTDVIDYLLKNNANINCNDDRKFTPLHGAVVQGCVNNVMILIMNKANVNCKTITNKTPLHAAALYGYVNIVKILLENNADVNAKDTDGNTPLHFAVESGNKIIVEMLLNNNASFNSKNNDKETPLTIAVLLNRINIVELLISKGANINYDKCKLLFHAVAAGFMDIVKIFLDNNAIINVKDSSNITLLHVAALRGYKAIVELLLQKGADVNAKNRHQHTPLIDALEDGCDNVIDLLLKYGADVNSQTTDGSTPLHFAAKHCNCKTIQTLIEAKAEINVEDNQSRRPVDFTIFNKKNQNLQALKIFLDCKIDINVKGNEDWTLLHVATQGGDLAIVKLLVKYGADVNAVNIMGAKPLHIAARDGFKDILEYFLTNGMDINEVNKNDQTLLHYAAIEGHIDISKYLIDNGININVIDFVYETPVHTAVKYGRIDLIRILLNNGAIYNLQNILGSMPKDIAHNTSNKKIFKIFESTEKLFECVTNNDVSKIVDCIKNGASVNARNKKNSTPLIIAIVKNYEKVINILLENDANPNITGKNGYSPLHYATKFSYVNIVKSLLSYGAIYNAVDSTGHTSLDCAESNDIINLLKLTDNFFESVKNKNCAILDEIKSIDDLTIRRSLLNAKNNEKRSIYVEAVLNDFPEIEELTSLSLGKNSIQFLRTTNSFKGDIYHESNYDVWCQIYDNHLLVFNENNPGLFPVKKIIGKILYDREKYDQALKIYINVYKHEKELFKKCNPETGNNLGLILHRIGRDKEALKILEEVCDEQTKILGIDHKHSLNSLGNLAIVLEKLNRFNEALNINKFILKKYTNMYGDKHLFTVLVKNHLGIVLNSLKRYDEATKLLNEAYDARKSILGKNHPDTLRTLSHKNEITMNLKDYDESLKTYREIYETQSKVLGSNHMDTINTQFNIAQVLFLKNDLVSAFETFSINYTIRKSICGPNNPDVIETSAKIESIKSVLTLLHGKDYVKNILEKDNMITAVKNGDIKRIEYLIKNGIDVNNKDIHGRTSLHYAIDKENINVINCLLKNNADITSTTMKNNTTLHMAVNKNNVEIINLLFKNKSIVDKKLSEFINLKTTVSGTTALHIAAQNNNLQIVQILLKSGAMYNLKNNDNKTPSDLTSDKNTKDFFSVINKLFEFTRNGNVKIIEKLGTMILNEFLIVINVKNDNAQTLLQSAIFNKHKNIAIELINVYNDVSFGCKQMDQLPEEFKKYLQIKN